MANKQIVIVGGGSAGWITALFVHRNIPNANITVIESSELGILGAGEGTTPNFVDFLDEVGIPVSDLVKETGATIKNGIKFTNWNNDKDHYYHPFTITHDALNPLEFLDLTGNYQMSSLFSVANDVPHKDYNFMTRLCELNKVPHVPRYGISEKVSNVILEFTNLGKFAVHFDAQKLAVFLKKVALQRGVTCIDGIVTEIKSDENEHITSLVLNSGHSIPTDFVFDCSGFRRLIIGNHFKSKWISYKEKLPVDTAIPFFLEMTKDIPPYTEAISMKYGWMWKIPLQNRYGCGYVFDSSLITEQEAIEEIETYLGYSPTYPRADKGGFKFKAGFYEKIWVKNCIAIGLSSGFIEPLEATSIFSSLTFLRKALTDLMYLETPNEDYVARYNKEVLEFSNEIFNFIYFHYLGDRNDSEFWENFKDENNHPEKIKELLFTIKNFVMRRRDFDTNVSFTLPSWLVVSYGLNKLNKELYKKCIESNSYNELYMPTIVAWKTNVHVASTECISHKKFLERLKNETI